MTSPRFDSGSFRDREGRVFYHDKDVYRALSQTAFSAWQELERCDFFRQAMADGKIVTTRQADWTAEQLTELVPGTQSSPWVAALAHERIPFISYPYEWSFSMLRDAALLQLELLRLALTDGMVLKDASSYNIQWLGRRPTFIDISSFEAWRKGDPWVGYLQFCQLFLYPLFLTAYRDIPFHPWLRGAIDGIPPEACNRVLTWRDCLRPGVLSHVYLQAKLREKPSRAPDDESLRSDIRKIGFSKEMILRNVQGIERVVQKLSWKKKDSEWASYASNNSYDDAGRQAKEAFVENAAKDGFKIAWDLGANTGHFSRLIAPHGNYVIAFDSDHLSVEHLYRELKANGPDNILPLVCNLADASPSWGWRGLERHALTKRSRPDLTLALALIHHMVISANIPLPDFVEWITSLGPRLVIEFVTKDDPMVKRLLRNKEDIYDDYSQELFESCLSDHCEILNRQLLPSNTRILYSTRRRRNP